MKRYLSSFLILGTAAVSGYGSTTREHLVSELHKSSEKAVQQFSADLSYALNALKHCKQKEKDSAQYGTKITKVTYTDDRTDVRTSTIEADGVTPQPSGKPYKVTIMVSSKPVKTDGPQPEDSPGQREYTCKVTVVDEKK